MSILSVQPSGTYSFTFQHPRASVLDAAFTKQLYKDGAASGSIGTITEVATNAAGAVYTYDITFASDEDVFYQAIILETATPDMVNAPTFHAITKPPTAAEVNTEVDTALSDYDGPTKAELDTGFAALNDLSAAEVNAEVDTALSDYDAPTRAELSSDIATVTSAISALNDVSTSDIDTALATYDAPTRAEATADKDEIVADIAALNDLSSADIATELATYDGPTRTELTSDKDEIITQVNANETKIDTIDTNLDSVKSTVDTNLNATVTSRSSHSASDVETAIKDTSVESDGSVTLQQAISIILAACAGETSGGQTTFKSPGGGATRIAATLDASNDRTTITITPSS